MCVQQGRPPFGDHASHFFGFRFPEDGLAALQGLLGRLQLRGLLSSIQVDLCVHYSTNGLCVLAQGA